MALTTGSQLSSVHTQATRIRELRDGARWLLKREISESRAVFVYAGGACPNIVCNGELGSFQ